MLLPLMLIMLFTTISLTQDEYPVKALPSDSSFYGASSLDIERKYNNNNNHKNRDVQFINFASESKVGQDDRAKHQRTHASRTVKFPLPECYINVDGFMCCSKQLEQVMDSAYKKLAASRNGQWKKCNIQQVSVAVQEAVEIEFGVPFELVVGAGDYASKNYFSQNLICKIKRGASYILAFATPTA